MIDLLSIVERPLMLQGMTAGLGAFIKDRRQQLGITQTELAERSALTKSHLSAIESGKIGLPNADIRRKLAEALGVTHLDLLVAAGELTAGEARALGGGLTGQDADPRKERIYALLRTAAIPDPYYLGLIPMLEALQPGAPQARESVERSGANGQ